MAKVGRNERCPCGSEKKYKRCHGDLTAEPLIHVDQFNLGLQRHRAKEMQRQRQQGLGRPVISGRLGPGRVVAVKNRLMFSKSWATFHDFLFEYLMIAIGKDWCKAELEKAPDQQHPILVWYAHALQIRQGHAVPGEVTSAPATGAVQAYLLLAYDLYAMDHNAELQQKMVARLRIHDQFHGARYEVFVAAALLRAGFTLTFEDEDDRQSSHCEFTATYAATGKQFSVEAKCRASNGKFRLGRLLCRALQKQAAHERLIFIELNMPDTVGDDELPQQVNSALNALRAFEGRDIEGSALPPAYVVITNSPWHYHLEATEIRWFAAAEGFQIADFKHDAVHTNLHEAIESRERHKEVIAIIDSLKAHRNPPSTFDGDIPEFAFGEADPGKRLLIGHQYPITGPDGSSRLGTLSCVTVDEDKSIAIGGVNFDDGTAVIADFPLSSAELNAWRRHPDTFFGQPQHAKKADGPLGLYDFMLHGFSATSKQRLLELMENANDIDRLRELPQAELVRIYAERATGYVMAMAEARKQPKDD